MLETPFDKFREECGVVAVYHLPGREKSPLCPEGSEQATRLLPKMLLDIQNRGQLAAGLTRYRSDDPQLLLTHKEVGSVSEVFALGHRERYDRLMSSFAVQGGDAMAKAAASRHISKDPTPATRQTCSWCIPLNALPRCSPQWCPDTAATA